jgi:tetratricopeptide (TPR) repeat protein
MPGTEACPPLGDLEQFLLGRLAGPAADLLEEHLLSCTACAKRLRSSAHEDRLLEALGAPTADAPPASTDSVQALIQRLRQVPPPGAGPATQAEASTPAGGTAPPHAIAREAAAILAPPRGPGELGWLGRYRVLQVLGAGGMGIVLEAEDTALRRPVALKVMKGAAADDPARQRFLQEARATAALIHDHVVTIHDVGEVPIAASADTVPFFAMQLLHGETLEARLRREGRLPVAEVLRIGREVAAGLAAAHARGLIHRDVKPANIWLEAPSGRVKILDFGLVRVTGDEPAPAESSHDTQPPPGNPRLTQEGAIVGTPAYMAPEQARGEAVDARCDLFSLGCVLYRCCTGTEAFPGKDAVSMLLAASTRQPEPPARLVSGLPPPLSALVMRLLAKQPQERPASAEDVAAALAALAQHRASSLPSLRSNSIRLLLLGAGAVALAVVVAGVLLLMRPRAATVNREGMALLDKGERDEAIKKFDRAVEIDPKFADAYTNRARAYYEKHDYDRAHDDASSAINLDRKAARAYVYRAAAYDKLDQYVKSLVDCEEALRLDPKLALAYVYRASAIHSLRHDKAAALADCNKALQLDPDLALAYLVRSACYEEGAYKEALADSNRAIEKAPTLAAAYALRGTLKVSMKQPDALKDFDRAHELDPHDPATFVGRAAYFFQKGDLDTALGDANQAIALGPKLAGGYTWRAMIRCNKGKELDKALDDAVKATQLDPWSSNAHLAKAMAYLLGKNDADQAFDECTVALRLDPKSGLAYVYRGLARFAKAPKDVDSLERALQDVDEALKLVGGGVIQDVKRVRGQIAEALKKARAGQKGSDGRHEGP